MVSGLGVPIIAGCWRSRGHAGVPLVEEEVREVVGVGCSSGEGVGDRGGQLDQGECGGKFARHRIGQSPRSIPAPTMLSTSENSSG